MNSRTTSIVNSDQPNFRLFVVILTCRSQFLDSIPITERTVSTDFCPMFFYGVEGFSGALFDFIRFALYKNLLKLP